MCLWKGTCLWFIWCKCVCTCVQYLTLDDVSLRCCFSFLEWAWRLGWMLKHLQSCSQDTQMYWQTLKIQINTYSDVHSHSRCSVMEELIQTSCTAFSVVVSILMDKLNGLNYHSSCPLSLLSTLPLYLLYFLQELCGREFERERSLAYACPLEGK